MCFSGASSLERRPALNASRDGLRAEQHAAVATGMQGRALRAIAMICTCEQYLAVHPIAIRAYFWTLLAFHASY